MDRTTELLSDYTCSLNFGQLPEEVVHQVKRTLIDTVGCALGGVHSPPAQVATALAKQVKGPISSRIVGTHISSTPEMSSFANGCMIRYLDFNDAYASPSGGHPSDMLAGLLAISDAIDCDGPRTVAAIVTAYEVFCRLSDCIPVGEHGWDHTTLIAIGTVCGIGKLREFDRHTMKQAISLTAVSNIAPGIIRIGELSQWKGCATANASRNAIFAAQLAERGMTGPEFPFEGQHGVMQKIMNRCVEVPPFDHEKDGYRIMSTLFKIFPCQTHTQGPISLALQMRPQVSIDDIRSIHIRTYKKAVASASTDPEKWMPKHRETADHSIPYLVAFAFNYGPVTPDSFRDGFLNDDAIQRLIKKISVEEDVQFTSRFSQEYNCHMEVKCHSGKSLSTSLALPKGFPGNPLSDIEVEKKFFSLAKHVLSKEQYQQTLNFLWSLDRTSSFKSLFDSLILAQ